jgi:hypothetical protein
MPETPDTVVHVAFPRVENVDPRAAALARIDGDPRLPDISDIPHETRFLLFSVLSNELDQLPPPTLTTEQRQQQERITQWYEILCQLADEPAPVTKLFSVDREA